MELTDIGYILKTSNIFISDTSKSSKEIKSKISYPVLEIDLVKKDINLKPYQIDGGVSYRNYEEIDLIHSCIKD
jgi:hypothetical protein